MGSNPACGKGDEEYNKQWKMMMAAYGDSSITFFI